MSKAKKFAQQHKKSMGKAVDSPQWSVKEFVKEHQKLMEMPESAKKSKSISMPVKEFVKEHKRLVGILKQDCGAEGKKEAKLQQQELDEHAKKSDYATGEVGCGSGLAGKICRHNRKKLNRYQPISEAKDIAKTVPEGVDKEKYDRCIQHVKRQRSGKNAYAICAASLQGKVKKSIDFQETKTAVDSTDQLLAEKTASPELINYLKTSVDSELTKIPFAKGALTLAEKEPGLYNGFFQDKDGQVVEKFDSMTLEIIAKNMEIKDLYRAPATLQDVAAAHDRIDMVQKQLDEQPSRPVKSLKIKFGDFELELRKSVRDFAQRFAKARTEERQVDQDLIKKAIESWRKKHQSVMDVPNTTAAAKEIFDNWEEHKEGFNQIVYALQQVEDDE